MLRDGDGQKDRRDEANATTARQVTTVSSVKRADGQNRLPASTGLHIAGRDIQRARKTIRVKRDSTTKAMGAA